MFPNLKNIGKKLASYNLTIIIFIAVLSITFSLYRISEAEEELSKNIQQLSRENEKYSGISEEIYHLADKLTMATHLFINTNDEQWKEKYKYNRNRLSGLLSKELRATSDEFILRSIEELKSAEIRMVAIENKAMRHIHRGEKEIALSFLNDEDYIAQKAKYSAGLNGISEYLLNEADENKSVISEGLKQNRLLYFIILMTNLGTWLLLVTMFNRSRKQVASSNIELQRINHTLKESLKLEQNDAAIKDDAQTVMAKYLKFLKEHLPFSNFHILEQQNDAFIPVESLFDQRSKSFLSENSFLESKVIKNYINQVLLNDDILGYQMGRMIEKSDLINNGPLLDCICTPIKFVSDKCYLLFIEGELQSEVKESDLGILQTIARQLKISLDNANIYSSMEDTIEHRTFQLKSTNLKLREKEEKLTAAQQIAKLGSWEISHQNNTITISNEVKAILEIDSPKNVFDAAYFAEFVEATDFDEALENYAEFIRENNEGKFELKIKSKSNQIKYVYIRAAEKKVEDGEISSFGTIQDITDRKKIELAYKESRERFLNVFENNQTGVVVTDENHQFTMVNSQFVNMLGYSKEELMNMTILDIANIEQRDKSIKSFDKLVKGEIRTFVEQKQYNRKDGQHVHVITKTFGNYNSENKFIEAVASILDITQQVESNKKVMESIIETENLERTRIATTLHDSIGQNLTSLHLMLGSIAKSNTIEVSDLESVKKAIKITKDTILETRQISHNLMPKYISRFGLLASVDNLVKDLNSTNSGIEFSLYTNFSDKILSISIQIAIYRIVQEAVNNILKYSKATNVYLQLVKHGNIITVLIDDNGCGFDLDKVKNKESLGLKSIKNRANSISAELEIDTMPDRGTTISLHLTLNNEND